jgi:hypothetical protein
MLICPNKSSKEWKELSSKLGEDRATLAFFRNNGIIPELGKARELITNKGLLESFDSLPILSETSIIDSLKGTGLIQGEPVVDNGKTYYPINTATDDIGTKLGEFTNKFGTVLEYKGDYVTIDQSSVDGWNAIASGLALQNQSITDLCKSFLNKIGVGLSIQDDVISRYGSNGIADIAERMVTIQSGMIDQALPEEALHFFIEMMPQDDPNLMEALDKIRNTKTYKETLEKYKNNPNYKINGVTNFEKIKKEALAKEIANKMKTDEKTGWIAKVIDAIMNWVKGVKIQKEPIDILTEMFYAQDIASLNTNLDSTEIYNQLADEQKAFYESQEMNEAQRATLNKVISYVAATGFDPVIHTYTNANAEENTVLKSVTKILGSDFYSDLDNSDVIDTLIDSYDVVFSELLDENDSKPEKAKKIIDEVIRQVIVGESTKEDLDNYLGINLGDLLFKAAQAKQKTLFGTAIHSIVEALILEKDFDIDELLAGKKIENVALSNLIDRKTLDRIVNGTTKEPGIKEILRNLRQQGHIVMTEISLSNNKLAGTIDIIAIDKDGIAHIYDFKTKYLKNFGDPEAKYVKKELLTEFNSAINTKSRLGVKDEPDTLESLKQKTRTGREKFGQQLSIYKKMLMEAGVPVGSLNVIGIPYRLDKKTNKVSEIKAVVVEDLAYNEGLANYYFPTLDTSLNASAKKQVILKQDERIKTIEKIKKEKLKEAFAKALGRLTEISKRYNKSNSKEELYQLLNNLNSQTNKLDIQKSNVTTVLENFDDVVDFVNIQNNFLEMIDSSVPIIETVVKYFDSLKNTTPTNKEGASQRLNELMKAKDFLVGYQNMFRELLGYMGADVPLDNPVANKLNQLIGLISGIRDNYIDTITPTINEMIGDIFNEDSLNTIKREYNELIAAARVRKDVDREKQLIKERDDLPSEKVINELLKGNKGDAGWLFSKLVATASNPDIVLAGVAKKLKASLDRVRLQNKVFRDSLGKELQKRFDVYGRGMDIKEMNKALTYIVEEFNPYATDEKKRTMNVLYFLSEFDEKLYTDYSKILHKIRQAEEAKDKEAVLRAKQEKREFERDYMQTGYTDEYYKLTKPLDTVVTYQNRQVSVREIDREIRDQIKNLEAQYSEDDKLNGKFNPVYLKELQTLNDQKAALREKLDEFGNPKKGDALKIAEILEQFDKDFKKLFEFVDQTEYYNRAREKAKLEYGEDSEEFKKWEADNTRIVIKDEFYKDQEALYQEQAQLLGDIQSTELSDLYKERSNLTKGYRDKDGNIKGSMISDETAAKIKELDEKINIIRNQEQFDLFNGLTKEEKDRLDVLNYAKTNNLPYSRAEVGRILTSGQDRINQKIVEDPEFGEKLDRLLEIRKTLGAMSKSENTKYYYEELEKQERIFAESLGISYDELLEGKDEFEKSYYKQFKESEWYQQNHIIKTNILYEDEITGDTREATTTVPTYQWKRALPVDEKYIEQKPGRHFTKMVEKESYINDKGETIKLKDDNNLDIRGRFKPKTNEQYKAEKGVDHPYLNKEFAELKNKYKSGTASQKEKVDYENLLYIHDKLSKSQENISLRDRLGFAVPFVEKTMFERTIETGGGNIKNKGQSIIDGVKRAIGRTDQDADENGILTTEEATSMDSAKLATMDNDQVKHIPVRFSTKGEAENASYNVWEGVLSYVSSINRKSELEKDLAFINGLEEILGEKTNQPKSENKNLILNNIYKKYIPELEARINKGGNIRLDTLKSFVNSVMYNEEYFQGFDMFGVNTQKAISNVSKLSSLTILGAAPINWAVNWMSGNIQNMVEAVGGRNYSMKDFTAAHKDIYGGGKYGSAISDMKDDYVKGKVGNLSFWGQIMELFDPIQGEFENEYGAKTNFNHVKNIFHMGMFAGRIWGEWEIQMKSFIAFTKNYKVYDGTVLSKEDFITRKIGTDIDSMSLKEISAIKLEALKEWETLETNLLDLFETNKEGVVVVKDEFKNVFELGSQKFSDIVGNLHAMQKRLNGSYAKFDKAYAEKTSVGRMMFFFKKYFIPIGMNRWGTRRTNYESMDVEQGFYLTFLQTAGKDLVKFKFNVIKNWHTYSDKEKMAIKKTLADIGIVLSIVAMYTLLFGFNPDDPDRLRKLREKGWAAQAAVFMLLRVRSETEQFLPWAGLEEIKGVYNNPSLILNQTSSYINMSKLLAEHALNVLPGVDFNSSLYYSKDVDESGLKDEGDSKLIAQMMKTFVGYSGKTFHPVDAIKAWEYLQKQR